MRKSRIRAESHTNSSRGVVCCVLLDRMYINLPQEADDSTKLPCTFMEFEDVTGQTRYVSHGKHKHSIHLTTSQPESKQKSIFFFWFGGIWIEAERTSYVSPSASPAFFS